MNSIENNAKSFLPIQSWKSLQSLVLGLVGLNQANVIEEKQTIFFQEQQILMELKIILVVQDKMVEVEMPQQRKNNKQMMQEHLNLLSQLV